MQHHPVQGDRAAGTGMETVTITKMEYIHLISISHQFENLTRSLLQGGVSQETLDALVKSPVPFPLVPQQLIEFSPGFIPPQEEFRPPQESGLSAEKLGQRQQKHVLQLQEREQQPQPISLPVENGIHSARWDELASPNGDAGPVFDDLLVFSHDEKGEVIDSPTTRSPFAKEDADLYRIIKISQLPERATLRNVINEIRGGAVAEIQRKANDGSIIIAFVEPSAALNFYKHVQQNGLYILGKQVSVEWAEHQFPLSPFVKQRIERGASRILVLRHINTDLLTASIFREHLDHIHNLEIVNIEFRHKKVIIRTNSVHKAIFARNCMMSRYEYRGVRIEFGHDECAEPLILQPWKRAREAMYRENHSSKALPPNRYEVLNSRVDEDQ